MTIFLLAVVASRTGLWVFDIVIALLMQEFVPAGSRGLVGGTHSSINSFFTLAASSLGLYFSRPDQFYVFVISSFSAVGVATVLYTIGVFWRRQYFLLAGNDDAGSGLVA